MGVKCTCLQSQETQTGEYQVDGYREWEKGCSFDEPAAYIPHNGIQIKFKLKSISNHSPAN